MCIFIWAGTPSSEKTISSAYKDKTNILTFQGIRRNESASRSKYERETESPKISKQTVAAPIIDWIDFDVWLYILTTKSLLGQIRIIS